MGIVKGGFQRLFQSGLYLLAFCCAAIILGIYSFFLAQLSDHKQGIPKYEKAIEGISGAGVLYTIAATLLTCCLGGITVFAFLGIVLDVLFLGGFIAIAILARSGASSCKGVVNTPLGTGSVNTNTFNENSRYVPNYRTACKLNTAVFAIAIIGAFLFLCTALMQIALARHHKKEKRYGPSPDNNYTSGKRRGMFGRRNKAPKTEKDHARHEHEAELGAAGVAGGAAAAHHHHNKNTSPDMRPSHDTGYTGSTVQGNHNQTGLVKDADPVYHNGTTSDVHHGHAPHGSHGGYYTQPQGTGVNPYGYDNTATNTAANAHTGVGHSGVGHSGVGQTGQGMFGGANGYGDYSQGPYTTGTARDL